MEYYSAKGNEIIKSVGKWIDLEYKILSKIIYSQKEYN